MIWRSQCNQIIILLKNERNKINEKYYIINSVGMGNFGIGTRIEDGWDDGNTLAPTRYNEMCKVKNIYDLAENIWEWTLEAYGSNNRIKRGGRYDGSDTNYTKACKRSAFTSPSTISGYNRIENDSVVIKIKKYIL